MPNIELKKRIMRRVYMIWLFRKITSPFALESAAFMALTVWLLHYFSLKHVIINALSLSSPASMFNFFTSAFMSTELIVQVLSLAVLAAFAVLARDIVRTMKPIFNQISFK